ncbi:MAG: winged helix-turn-helix transcriptional regulator [Sandaracinaceae bacterium]|nr:winged helix-turn-helix transcriptional regulator [Sandaracinaceae bacterium]
MVKELQSGRVGDVACCVPGQKLRARDTKRFAQTFKALGDETRLEIIGLLAAAKGELCVCDLESHFSLSQPTISHHLRLLRDADLVSAERRGTWVYYTLKPKASLLLAEFHLVIAG